MLVQGKGFGLKAETTDPAREQRGGRGHGRDGPSTAPTWPRRRRQRPGDHRRRRPGSLPGQPGPGLPAGGDRPGTPLAEPMHPDEPGRRRKQHGKNRNIKYNRGSLYMVVEQLRNAGFITQQQTVRTPAPRARHLQDHRPRPRRAVRLDARTGRPTARGVPVLRGRLLAAGRALPNGGGPAARPAPGDVDRAGRGSPQGLRKAYQDGVRWVFLVEEEYRLGCWTPNAASSPTSSRHSRTRPTSGFGTTRQPSCQKGQA